MRDSEVRLLGHKPMPLHTFQVERKVLQSKAKFLIERATQDMVWASWKTWMMSHPIKPARHVLPLLTERKPSLSDSIERNVVIYLKKLKERGYLSYFDVQLTFAFIRIV